MQTAWSSPVQTQAVSVETGRPSLGALAPVSTSGVLDAPVQVSVSPASETGRFLLHLCSGATRPLSQAASVSIFYWTVPMIYFRMSSTGASVAFFSSLWQVCLVAISVELSFALEVLSHSGLPSSLFGVPYQDVIISALRPVAPSFNAWFRSCLRFSVQADMSALSSLPRHFLGRILLCKIFWRKGQQFAVWCLPAPSV